MYSAGHGGKVVLACAGLNVGRTALAHGDGSGQVSAAAFHSTMAPVVDLHVVPTASVSGLDVGSLSSTVHGTALQTITVLTLIADLLVGLYLAGAVLLAVRSSRDRWFQRDPAPIRPVWLPALPAEPAR